MRREALLACALVGCASSGSVAPIGGGDASLFVAAEDASSPAIDAGPLWQRCEPASPASCPAGFECFPAHTAPVDAFDTCVFTCADGGEASCALRGGTCACALSVTGGPGDCAEGNDAGAVTVCAPAGDGVPAGDNVLEDSGAPPEDAGASDAGAG
jgi:hypothetical protein